VCVFEARAKLFKLKPPDEHQPVAADGAAGVGADAPVGGVAPASAAAPLALASAQASLQSAIKSGKLAELEGAIAELEASEPLIVEAVAALPEAALREEEQVERVRALVLRLRAYYKHWAARHGDPATQVVCHAKSGGGATLKLVARRYINRQEELFTALERKYGPELASASAQPRRLRCKHQPH
jgi:hypothetical protein